MFIPFDFYVMMISGVKGLIYDRMAGGLGQLDFVNIVNEKEKCHGI